MRIASPMAYLVNTIPMPNYLPKALAPFNRKYKRLYAIGLAFL